MELAFVEVSSDGINFVRFDAHSEVQTTTQVDGFGNTDPTEINNLAGKYRGQYGTPFDLAELIGVSGLDVQNITHIKVIDVVGSIGESHASYDAFGNKINDPYPTNFPSGGFDLDAIGVINEKPLSVGSKDKSFALFPNPTSGIVNIQKSGNCFLRISNISGQTLIDIQFSEKLELNLYDFPAGVYSVNIDGVIQKLIIL